MSDFEEDKHKRLSWVQTVYNPAAIATSALAGGVTTRYLINDEAHATLKKYGLFDDILGDHRDRLHQTAKEAAKHAKNEGFIHTLKYEVEAEQSRFFPLFMNRMKDVGIRNVFDEWKTIHRGQRFQSVILGLSVTGVFLGAAMEIGRELDKYYNQSQNTR